MIINRNTVLGVENLTFLYSGLHGISGTSRKYLKKIAASLIALQNRPGAYVPDNVSQEIMRNPTIDMFINDGVIFMPEKGI